MAAVKLIIVWGRPGIAATPSYADTWQIRSECVVEELKCNVPFPETAPSAPPDTRWGHDRPSVQMRGPPNDLLAGWRHRISSAAVCPSASGVAGDERGRRGADGDTEHMRMRCWGREAKEVMGSATDAKFRTMNKQMSTPGT